MCSIEIVDKAATSFYEGNRASCNLSMKGTSAGLKCSPWKQISHLWPVYIPSYLVQGKISLGYNGYHTVYHKEAAIFSKAVRGLKGWLDTSATMLGSCPGVTGAASSDFMQ